MPTILLIKTFLGFCVINSVCSITTQRSIVLVYGLLDNESKFYELQPWIETDFPNVTTVVLLPHRHRLNTVRDMWTQVKEHALHLERIMNHNPGGVKVICSSQGGLVCRGMLSTMRHNVDTFIALSSPLAGQYGNKFLKANSLSNERAGIPKFTFARNNQFKEILIQASINVYLTEDFLQYCYSEEGQETSIGNYWNDPHHQEEYFKWNKFLTVLNNQTYNERSLEFRENFLTLKRLVLIGGSTDEVVSPWQSSQFGFYDEHENIVPMTQQSWYLNDAFGLRTLNEQGKLTLCNEDRLLHMLWANSRRTYEQCIKPWLY